MCCAVKTAGTRKLSIKELRKLGREHSDNWSEEKLIDVYGCEDPFYALRESSHSSPGTPK
jgi:hypothetical protein